MNNKSKKDMQKQSFTQIFSYQLDEVNKDARYNSYLVPLHWFVKLYTRRTHKMTMGDIAKQMGIDSATFSKMLRHGIAKDKRQITSEHINRICEIINIPLSSILFLYEHKEAVEKNLQRNDFEKLTNLLRGNFDEIWKEIRKASFGRNGSLSDCFVAECVGQMLEYGNFIEHFVSDFYNNLHNCCACTSVTGLCQNSGTS